jgi:putative DNA primase/helicase
MNSGNLQVVRNVLSSAKDVDPFAGLKPISGGPNGGDGGSSQASPAKIEITEDGVALAFTSRFDGQLRFDHDAGQWFEFKGDFWQIDEKSRAYSYCREIARAASADSSPREMAIVRRASFASGVERFARADPRHAVTQKVWDADPWLLGAPDQTIDLRTGQGIAPRSADGITKRVAVAPSTSESCPIWFQFLEDATGASDDVTRFLAQWVGYNLTGDTREHSLVFLHGDGGNGKSVFLNTIAGMMGDYSKAAAMATFVKTAADRHPTDLASLRGARMVTASETEEGRAWDESRIKVLTGGDMIAARFMRQDFFEFRPNFKLTMVFGGRPVRR